MLCSNKKLIIFFSLLFFSSIVFSSEFCSKENTNFLIWDKDFSNEVGKIFNKKRESLFWNNGKIGEQILAGLGGPPDKLKHIKGNFKIASACRAHSCTEKAAVILKCPSKIAGAAILSSRRSKNGYNKIPYLKIFYTNEASKNIVNKGVKDWVNNKKGKNKSSIIIDKKYIK